MQSLTVEAFKLIQCVLHNPLANKVLTSSRLDDGTPAANMLNNEFYANLLVGDLKHAGLQDIITASLPRTRSPCPVCLLICLPAWLSVCLSVCRLSVRIFAGL